MNEDKGQMGSGRDLRRLLQFLKNKKKKQEKIEQEEIDKKKKLEKEKTKVIAEDNIKDTKENKEEPIVISKIKIEEITSENEKEIENIKKNPTIPPIIPIINIDLKEKGTKEVTKIQDLEIEKSEKKEPEKKQDFSSNEELPRKENQTINDQTKESLFEKEKIEPKKTNITSNIPPVIIVPEIEKEVIQHENEKEIENSTIYQELEKTIKKIENKISLLEYDLYQIESEIDKEQDKDKIEKEKEKLKEIKKELEKLQKKIDIEILDKDQNKELYQEITKYIDEVKSNGILYDLENDSTYLQMNKKIDEILDKAEKVESNVNEKEKEIDKTNETLKKSKEKYDSVERIHEELYYVLAKQQKIESDIKKKVSECEHYEDRIRTIYLGMNDTATNLLLSISASKLTKGMPKLLFTAMSIKNSFKLFHELINPKTKKEHYMEKVVDDYRDTISESLSDIEQTKKEVRSAIHTIDDLLEDIKSLPYIPYEYKDLLYHLNALKENIQNQELEMNKIEGNVQNSYKKNKVKLLTKGGVQ